MPEFDFWYVMMIHRWTDILAFHRPYQAECEIHWSAIHSDEYTPQYSIFAAYIMRDITQHTECSRNILSLP